MRALVVLVLVTAPLAASRGAEGVVITEIHYHPSSAESRSLEFVEIHNPGATPVEVAGWRLRGGVHFTFPAGTVLGPGAYLVVCKDCARVRDRFGGETAGFGGNFEGSLDNAGDSLELVDAFNALVDAVTYDDRAPWPEDADGRDRSLQRLCSTAPGRDALNWTAAAPTPLAVATGAVCPPPVYRTPPVVISEIQYHPRTEGILRSAWEDGEDEEFVELHNPGATEVNLSGFRLEDGIFFVFPNGSSLPAGGYLAVCRDQQKVREKYGITNTAGDFGGRLSNQGERVALVDRQGNPVDSVSYAETGEWPPGADGLGRSLEKVVLTLPGDDPANWRASALDTSAWHRLEAEGSFGQGLLVRFLIAIDGAGEFLIDNVSCVDVAQPETNLLQNGSFDAGIDGWNRQGLASGSAHAPGQGVEGTGALRLVSTGSCPNGDCGASNSVSASLPSGLDRSHRYRVSLEYHHLSGSPLLRAGLTLGARVSVSQVATPGRPNSAAGAQLPLFISHLNRYPTEPRSTDHIWITAQVRSAAPPEVEITYRAGAAGQEATAPMLDDGLHRDGRAGDGVFGAELPSAGLPAFDHNTAVTLRIRARLGGETAEYPRPLLPGAPLPEEGTGFYVNDLQPASALPVYHLMIPGMPGANPNTLNNFLNCQTLKKADFAFEGDLYPEIGIRFRGNTACYILKRNFKLVFNKGRYFRGLHKVNLNGLYTDKALLREHLAWEFLREIGAAYSETYFTRVHLNGIYHGLFLYVEHPDSRFLRRNGLDAGGNLYKALAPPFSEEQVVGVPQMQPSPEGYRNAWEEETNEGGDFADVAAFVDGMHQDGRKQGGPTSAFWESNSLPEMMIHYQISQVVLNNIDSFAKNHFLYHDFNRERWGFLTWDLDLTFGKFFTFDAVGPGRPVGTLNDLMLSDPGVKGDLNPWFGARVLDNLLLNHLVDLFLRAGGGFYQRAYLVRLWDVLQEKYRNDLYDPRLDRLAALLAEEEQEDHERWGRYPTNVAGYPEDMLANVEIMKKQIRLHKGFLESYLRRYYPQIPRHPRVKITEIMYWPEQGDENLEFIEFLNPGLAEIDISGWSTSGVTYTFPSGSVIPGGGHFILASSPTSFSRRYAGASIPLVFGPYTGRLANEGEEVRLYDAGPGYPATVDFVRYESGGAWPEVDPGHSIELTRVSADRDNDAPANWIASPVSGGSPGRSVPVFIRSDANSSRDVDLSDAIFILNYLYLAGETPACLDAADTDDNATIDLSDAIVLILHLFVSGPAPQPPYPTAGPDPTADNLGCEG